MTGPRGWGLPESHLLPDAIVALVDGELSVSAQERALSHVARCAECATEVKAQRQARAEIQIAQAPCMSAGFLASLRSIPQTASLREPGGKPANESLFSQHLAVTEDGQLVAIQKPERVAGLVDTLTPPDEQISRVFPGRLVNSAPLGTSAPLGSSPALGSQTSPAHHRRRVVQGAGIAVSGLVLSALAFTAGPSGGVGASNIVNNPTDDQPKVLRAQFGIGSAPSSTASSTTPSSTTPSSTTPSSTTPSSTAPTETQSAFATTPKKAADSILIDGPDRH